MDLAGLGFITQNICFPIRDRVRILFCGRSTNFFVWLPVVLKSSTSECLTESVIRVTLSTELISQQIFLFTKKSLPWCIRNNI